VRGGTDGHGRRCCVRGRAAAGGGVVALPGVLGPAGRVGACPPAGAPGRRRDRVAAASAQVAVRRLRGYACAAAGELPAVGASAVAASGVALPDGFAPEPVENAAALPLTQAEQDLRLPSGGGARSLS